MAPALDRATIERVARAALETPDAVVVEHRAIPLEYDAYLPGRSVTRIEGIADVGGRSRPWSAVRKWTDSPERTPSAPWERGRREALAYRSGLITATAPLAAPRALAIELGDAGPIELWLEDVADPGPSPWPLSLFAEAARALGGFNGHWLGRPPPRADWLVPDWAERQSEPLDVPAAHARMAADAASPRARELLRNDAGPRAARMLDDQPALIRLLGQLPQVLCHHDAARSNLIARRSPDGATQIVALDWESTGPGAVGADIATLVSGSVRKGDVAADVLDDLDDVVFAGYAAGLRAAGWDGDARVVRLGYAASLALRCWLVRDTFRNLADPHARPILGRQLDTEPERALRAFARITAFLLDRADEARDLAADLGEAGILTAAGSQ